VESPIIIFVSAVRDHHTSWCLRHQTDFKTLHSSCLANFCSNSFSGWKSTLAAIADIFLSKLFENFDIHVLSFVGTFWLLLSSTAYFKRKLHLECHLPRSGCLKDLASTWQRL
jgi:hypothetical protein